jgi:hypothetical protein
MANPIPIIPNITLRMSVGATNAAYAKRDRYKKLDISL